MFSPIQIAGTGNGHTLGHGIKTSVGLEFSEKGFATRFQQGHTRFAVVDNFLTEIKGHITINLVSVPTVHRDCKIPNRGFDPRTVGCRGY